MGNIGRSSTGCGLCRKRKIKVRMRCYTDLPLLTWYQCDEARPGCKRCAQIRKPCPGYPFQVQLSIRAPQEDTSSGPSLTEQLPSAPLPPIRSTVLGRKSTSSSTHTGTSLSNILKIEENPNQSSLAKFAPAQRSISPPLRYEIQHQSLCFFLNLFCFQAGRLYSFPVLDFLPDMLRGAKDGTCIQKAAMAVSRMTLADRYSGKDVRLQTGREYGQALSLTNATIRDTRASIEDETVLAVWLLGLYEVKN